MIGWVFVPDAGPDHWCWATNTHILPFARREEAIIAANGKPGRLVLAKPRPHDNDNINRLFRVQRVS